MFDASGCGDAAAASELEVGINAVAGAAGTSDRAAPTVAAVSARTARAAGSSFRARIGRPATTGATIDTRARASVRPSAGATTSTASVATPYIRRTGGRVARAELGNVTNIDRWPALGAGDPKKI